MEVDGSNSPLHGVSIHSAQPVTKSLLWIEVQTPNALHLGLVFRLVGPRSNNWRPGIMGKKGNKWVWKENTLEELAAQGIHISQGPKEEKQILTLISRSTEISCMLECTV
jgi:hypothetical protein